MTVAKGDKVVINYVSWGYNVVDAVCTVTYAGPPGGSGSQHVKFMVTAEQGNSAPQAGEWMLSCPSPQCMPYLPPVKVGDVVKITGMMNSWSPGCPLPDERGCLARIAGKGISSDGSTYYKLKVEGNAIKWAYPRKSFSLDMEAELTPNVPPKAPPQPVTPVIKYKCINPPRKENLSGLL